MVVVIDKVAVTVLFLTLVFVASAILLIMGTVPKIFETSNQVNQTNVLLEHRISLTQQQIHEDEAREVQVRKILTNVDVLLNNMQHNLTQLMLDSEKVHNATFQERIKVVESITNLVKKSENASSTNLLLTKVNKQNIDNIMNNISSLVSIVNHTLSVVNDTTKENQDILKENMDILNDHIAKNENENGNGNSINIEKFDQILENQQKILDYYINNKTH